MKFISTVDRNIFKVNRLCSFAMQKKHSKTAKIINIQIRYTLQIMDKEKTGYNKITLSKCVSAPQNKNMLPSAVLKHYLTFS